MAMGPPAFHACPKVVNVPARTEMIVNEIAKLVKPLQTRFSSCLYPSSASCSASRSSDRPTTSDIDANLLWRRVSSAQPTGASAACYKPYVLDLTAAGGWMSSDLALSRGRDESGDQASPAV